MEFGVTRNESKAVDFRLGDQEPIEGVAVVVRKRADVIGVAGSDRQQVDAGSFELLEQVARCIELAESS